MSRSNEYTPIILELGSRNVRLGFAGDPQPSVVFNTSAKYPFHSISDYPQFLDVNNSAMSASQKVAVIEETVHAQADLDQLTRIYRGDRHRWIHLNRALNTRMELEEEKWHLQDLLSEMTRDGVMLSPRRCKVILVDGAFSLSTKFMLSELLLNKFKFKSVITSPSSVLTVVGANLRNGLVLDFGWESLKTSQVIDLRELSESVGEHFEFGGLTLHYLVVLELIRLKRPEIQQLLARDDFFDIIESFITRGMFVRSQEEDEVEQENDGHQAEFDIIEGISIPQSLRYSVLSQLYFHSGKLKQIIVDTLASANLDNKPLLLDNVIISGGLSEIIGFKYRVIQEIRSYVHTKNVNGKTSLGPWAGSSMYVSSVLVNEKKSVWKEQEITRDIINSLTTDDGLKLAGLPDPVNMIHKMNI